MYSLTVEHLKNINKEKLDSEKQLYLEKLSERVSKIESLGMTFHMSTEDLDFLIETGIL